MSRVRTAVTCLLSWCVKQGDGDGNLPVSSHKELPDRVHPYGHRGEVTSSCVPWEQSCGRQHMARAGQPSPGLWGMLHILPQGSCTSPGTQGGPESLLGPCSPGLVSVCPCTTAVQPVTLHWRCHQHRWVHGDSSSHFTNLWCCHGAREPWGKEIHQKDGLKG